MNTRTNKIILASQSKRRQELLHWLVDSFEIIPSDINEDILSKLARTPDELVVKLAIAKARRIINKCQNNAIIIAADTIVALKHNDQWQAIGKPKDTTEAIQILKLLRGKTHQVYTGLCVFDCQIGEYKTNYAVTDVTFLPVADSVIKKYVATGLPLDKAGAYGIQEISSDFVKKIKGSMTNVIGLPMQTLAQLLEQFQITLKTNWQEIVKEKTGYVD